MTRLSNIKLLIERGSPLNTIDINSRTTILYIVDSYNNKTLRIILKVGIDIDPEMSKGRFRSSPLITASFSELITMAKLLIKSDAKIDILNLERYSLLTRTIIYNNHAVLKLLIDRYNISGLKELQLLLILAQSANTKTIAILASLDLLK